MICDGEVKWLVRSWSRTEDLAKLLWQLFVSEEWRGEKWIMNQRWKLADEAAEWRRWTWHWCNAQLQNPQDETFSFVFFNKSANIWYREKRSFFFKTRKFRASYCRPSKSLNDLNHVYETRGSPAHYETCPLNTTTLIKVFILTAPRHCTS